jgi:hypothetical protein
MKTIGRLGSAMSLVRLPDEFVDVNQLVLEYITPFVEGMP